MKYGPFDFHNGIVNIHFDDIFSNAQTWVPFAHKNYAKLVIRRSNILCICKVIIYNITVRFKNVPIPTFMLSQAESKIAFISRTGKVPVKCLLVIKTLILETSTVTSLQQLKASSTSLSPLSLISCKEENIHSVYLVNKK